MHPYLENVVKAVISSKVTDENQIDYDKIFEHIGKHIDYMNAKLGWLSEAEMEDFYDALKDD